MLKKGEKLLFLPFSGLKLFYLKKKNQIPTLVSGGSRSLCKIWLLFCETVYTELAWSIQSLLPAWNNVSPQPSWGCDDIKHTIRFGMGPSWVWNASICHYSGPECSLSLCLLYRWALNVHCPFFFGFTLSASLSLPLFYSFYLFPAHWPCFVVRRTRHLLLM